MLTRKEFRTQVFERDTHTCVFCSEPAVDAHHILERRLFVDGGYHLNNGIAICKEHHLECERTNISVEDARDAAKITKKVLPEHFYADEIYDKWGNIVVNDKTRMRGELWYDEGVQRILEEHDWIDFVHHMKYPRTFHLPWSPGLTSDDRVLKSIDQFHSKEIVIMRKMDGENTTMYNDHIHARSLSSRSHPSRDWVKNFHAKIAHNIPNRWRINGENLYAKHSIAYDNLDSYFLGFAIWDGGRCMNWDDTLLWFELLEIKHVPVIYEGVWDLDKIRSLENTLDFTKDEGYVIRTREGFDLRSFKNKVGKYVRKDHIKTTKHWMHGQPIIPNTLKE